MQRASATPKPSQPQPTKAPPPASPQKELQGPLKKPTQLQESKGAPAEQKSKIDTSPLKATLPETKPTKDESGFFGLGFGGARSRSPSPQSTATAVSGKVLGFGTSFLSSASNLISSAVQDESSTTPPTSRKASAVSQTSVKSLTPPSSRKGSSVSQASEKISSSRETKSITTQQVKEIKDGEKTSVKQATKETSTKVKKSDLPKSCPLCNDEFKNDPLNFNTCTSCKNTVCNLCGFNPAPEKTEVKFLLLPVITALTLELI